MLILASLLVAATSTESFDLESKLRAGLLVGEPLALTVATDLAEGLVLHVDFGVSHRERESAVMAIDVAYRAEHIFGPLSETLWAMPFVGLGLRGSLGAEDRPDRFGFRIPVGLTVLERTEPLEVFVQIAVGMVLFPERRGTVDAGAGVRVGF